MSQHFGKVSEKLRLAAQQSLKKDSYVAIGYARYSDPNKVGVAFDSVTAQIAMIKEFVQSRPKIKLEEIFSDPGKSGKNTNRPGYQKMLSRIKSGGVDMIIAYKLDRLGRNDEDLREVYNLARSMKIDIVYTNGENFAQTPEGERQKQCAMATAVYEREVAAERISDKYIMALKNGLMYCGIRPLGYLYGKNPGEAVIDKETAPIIKKIFALYLEGIQPSQIAKEINTKFGPIPSRKLKNGKFSSGGKPFFENYIRRIIINPYYAGYVYSILSKPSSIDVKYQLFEGKHEGIISKKDWQKAFELIKTRRAKRENPQIRKPDKYLLKKYLCCECGYCMTVASSGKKTQTGEQYRYYACSRKKHEHSLCDCKTHLPLRIIEPMVFMGLAYFMRDDVKKTPFKANGEYETSVRDKIGVLKRVTAKLKKELDGQLDMLCGFQGMAAVKERIEEKVRLLGTEIETNNGKIKDLEAELNAVSYKSDVSRIRINAALDEDLFGLQENLTDDEKRELLSLTTEKLVLSCEAQKSTYRRDMSLRIFAKPEFAGKIQPIKIKFSVNTHSLAYGWEVVEPFRVHSENFAKPKVRKEHKRHWIHDVLRDNRLFEESKLSLRAYCLRENTPYAMRYRKFRLLENLSCDVLNFLAKITLKENAEIFSFRAVEKISLKPKVEQMEKIKLKIVQNGN